MSKENNNGKERVDAGTADQGSRERCDVLDQGADGGRKGSSPKDELLHKGTGTVSEDTGQITCSMPRCENILSVDDGPYCLKCENIMDDARDIQGEINAARDDFDREDY